MRSRMVWVGGVRALCLPGRSPKCRLLIRADSVNRPLMQSIPEEGGPFGSLLSCRLHHKAVNYCGTCLPDLGVH